VTPLMVVASTMAALAVAGIMSWLLPPTPRLGPRVRPYSSPAGSATSIPGNPVVGVFGPIVMRAATALGRRLDSAGDEALGVRLRQAGVYPELRDDERVAAFRLRQLRALLVGAVAGGVVGAALGMSTPGIVGLAVVGAVAVLGRARGRVERALESRRLSMRIEIYTIDQLLALRVRAGGGVMQAVGQVISRGRGEVIAELAEAVRLHRAGMSVAESFDRIADLSPEAACARTYRLLAIADERGVDLAAGLLALAEDVRETRREAMKRAATKRRAAMLIPTIALLAPTLLLFVAAPLPYLLTGWR